MPCFSRYNLFFLLIIAYTTIIFYSFSVFRRNQVQFDYYFFVPNACVQKDRSDIQQEISLKQIRNTIIPSSFGLADFGNLERNQYDYTQVIYPIPFNKLYQHKETHYESFGQCPSSFPDFVQCGEVSPIVYEHSELLVVTGSSSNHFYANINCIYTVLQYDIQTSIVFVDFGLSPKEIKTLASYFRIISSIQQQYNSTAILYYRRFNFANFPSFFSLKTMSVGGYAWKVVSYTDLLKECKGPLFWTDAGTLLNPTMNNEIQFMKEYGIYTPASLGTIREWVYPRSRDFMRKYFSKSEIDESKSMCTGGYLFIDGRNQTVMERIIVPLLQCAYTEKCIVPIPSSRLNHRQDQAILSVLIHTIGIEKACDHDFSVYPRFRRDCMDFKSCNLILKEISANINNKYSV